MSEEIRQEVEKAISRACWDYGSGLNTGSVKTRPERRAKAIDDGVEAVMKIIAPPTQKD